MLSQFSAPTRRAIINGTTILELLHQVRSGQVSPEEAAYALQDLPYQDLGFAKIDHHRALRRGFPEVVLGSGKSPSQIARISVQLAKHSNRLLVTRATPRAYQAVRAVLPDAAYHQASHLITLNPPLKNNRVSGLLIVTAGTSDLPTAEEASITATMLGVDATHLNDVGVAGVHRLLANMELLRKARVVIVVAGMEGALPSLVAGLISAPIIAVPTSIGYGANFDGLAPLLAMLNSCSPGIGVVNINNGFGAGYLASLVTLLSWGKPPGALMNSPNS